MTGRLLSDGRQSTAHTCEPGVIVVDGEPETVAASRLGRNARWKCDDCEVVWRWEGTQWERTNTTMTESRP